MTFVLVPLLHVGVGRTERCGVEGHAEPNIAGVHPRWIPRPNRNYACDAESRKAGAGIKPGHRSVVPSSHKRWGNPVQIDEGLASLAKRQVKKLTSALAGQGDEAGA